MAVNGAEATAAAGIAAEPLQAFEAGALVTGNVTLRVGGAQLEVEVSVPAGPVTLDALIPVFHRLTSSLVEIADAREKARGREISCRAGCGACCRHAVPMSPSEARALARVVAAMPEPRQTVVRGRFAAARAHIRKVGLDARPRTLGRMDAEGVQAFGQAYFALKIACPFLEDENCTIHPDRPSACREYIVTSPPEACSSPTLDRVREAALPGKVSLAVLNIDQGLENRSSVLLIDALEFAAKTPPPPAVHPGPALVQAVFARLAERSKN